LRASFSQDYSAHWQLSQLQDELLAPPVKFSLPSPIAPVADWIDWLIPAAAAVSAAVTVPSTDGKEKWWLTETQQRFTAILSLISEYTPWLLPKYSVFGRYRNLTSFGKLTLLP
jgi:hypothetical protein